MRSGSRWRQRQERNKRASPQELAKLQAAAASAPPAQAAAIVEQATEAAEALDLDEADTRRLIDEQLRLAGWEVDSAELSYAKGARPQKGKNIAIAEWPTEERAGRLRPLRRPRAGRRGRGQAQAQGRGRRLEQAKRYSRGYSRHGRAKSTPGGPWGEYKVPFLFATNGRPYLRQLETKSGIWFLDARRADEPPRALDGWYTPEASATAQAGHRQGRTSSSSRADRVPRPARLPARTPSAPSRAAIEKGERDCLVAMATGTGKTRTCIGLIYRLLKTRRFRRVLFLVDRSALGEQTANAFKDARLENLQTFTEIFDVKELEDIKPDSETKLHIATIQGMVKRILFPSDEDRHPAGRPVRLHRRRRVPPRLPARPRDVRHRVEFRDEDDYISKYRRVLDHFDAVKIGLTATPALHTTEIFGAPGLPLQLPRGRDRRLARRPRAAGPIVTELAEDGIHWEAGEKMYRLQRPRRRQLDTVIAARRGELRRRRFNRRVVTENFNRVVCEELAKHIDPASTGRR